MSALPDKKMKLGGLKLSPELCLVTLPPESENQPLLNSFCRLLSENEINVHLLISTDKGNQLCVAAENESDVERICGTNAEFSRLAGLVSPVGLMTVYPTGSSFQILSLLIGIFGNAGIELLGAASSLSSLTFIISYPELKTALRALLDHVDLPQRHSPFYQTIRIRQCGVEKEH